MDYYEISDDLYAPKKRWFLGSIDFDGEWDFWKYVKPQLVTPPERLLNVKIRSKGVPIDFTFADFELIIANEKIKNEVSDRDAQFFPLKVPGREELHYLMVINKEVECVDESKSVFDKWLVDDPIRPDKAGQYKTIYKLLIDKKRVPEDLHIFRLKSYNVVVLVSEKLKNAFEENGVTGIKYEKVSG